MDLRRRRGVPTLAAMRSRLVALLLRPVRTKLVRVANEIDRQHPGPHYPDTVGALWASFAANCRRLAADLA